MNKVQNVIHYLKDPLLVAKFQNKLGIQPLYHSNDPKEHRKFVSTDVDHESNTRKTSRDKTSLKSDKVSEDEGNTSEDLIDDNIQYKPNNENRVKGKDFLVKNKFLYYFFFIGTYLGDEIFYSIYFPFWFWNVDYTIGRRVITVWAVVMYVGQSLKDVIKWPRPDCPPAVRLQTKWSLEYGMPSTHAMIAVAIPTASIVFSVDKFDYPLPLAILLAVLMCSWVCTSRIYLGMHTVLDVLVGVLLAIAVIVITVPLLLFFDSYAVSWRFTPLVVLAVTISLVIFYPKCEWTPTRGDTTTVLGCIAGIYMAACIIHQLTTQWEPREVFHISYLAAYPQLQTIGVYLGRFLMGIFVIIMLEVILSTATHTVDRLLGLDPNEARDQRKRRLPKLDLTYKYITYWILGFTVAILPEYLSLGFNLQALL